MRSAGIFVALAAVACSGGTASTPEPEGTAAPPVAQPQPPRKPPAPVRVAFGQCTRAKVPFVSGSQLRYPRTQAGAFASLTGIGAINAPPQVRLGGATASNGLDKNIIRRYIRRQLPRIRHCYERELLVKPNLRGTVTVKFEIDASGKVSRSNATGGMVKVGACVATAIQSIRFPKPKSGGAVMVSYPFTFKPSKRGGSGRGGGGTGWGTIGTGKYGTIGHGSGSGTGYGTGSGRGGIRGRKAKPPQVRAGQATTRGALDKNIIRRYIRRRINAIKLCYERELLRQPKLAGKVTVRFTIEPSGRVSNVGASGLHPKVDSCVARQIARIRFPKPRGGGKVTVSYPFIFRGSGGGSGSGSGGGGTTAREKAIEQARKNGVLGVLSGGIERIESPARQARDAIEACAREHLHLSQRYDALIADLGDRPVVRSSGQNRGLERCVVEALASIDVEGGLRCPIAIGTMPTNKLPRLAVRAGSLRYGGQDLRDLDDGGDAELKQALRAYRQSIVAPGFKPDVATIGPVVVTADPGVTIARVRRVLALADEVGVGVALARSPDRLLRSEPLPWVPVPRLSVKPEGTALVVTVGSDTLVVGSSVVPLDRLADEVKRSERSRITIRADHAAPFEALVAVLERLGAAGITGWSLDL